MVHEMWLNIPVKNVQQSVTFFKAIGFDFSLRHQGSNDMECMLVSKQKNIVMLVQENLFKQFSQHEITNTQKSVEQLISFSVESKNEIDEIHEKVKNAGGNIFSAPQDVQGWMYGFAFTDLDGHRWNAIYMDMEKAK